MSAEKLIKVTKKNGSFSIVPAGQKATYESFNEKYKKLKKPDLVVTIEDYDGPASIDSTSNTGNPADNTKDSGTAGKPRNAVDVISDISKAGTAEEVEELAKGDTRATVVKAAESKIAELTKS